MYPASFRLTFRTGLETYHIRLEKAIRAHTNSRLDPLQGIPMMGAVMSSQHRPGGSRVKAPTRLLKKSGPTGLQKCLRAGWMEADRCYTDAEIQDEARNKSSLGQLLARATDNFPPRSLTQCIVALPSYQRCHWGALFSFRSAFDAGPLPKSFTFRFTPTSCPSSLRHGGRGIVCPGSGAGPN